MHALVESEKYQHTNFTVSKSVHVRIRGNKMAYHNLKKSIYFSTLQYTLICRKSSWGRTLSQVLQHCHKSRLCRIPCRTLEWVRLGATPDWEGQSDPFSCCYPDMFVQGWTCWCWHLLCLSISVKTWMAERIRMASGVYRRHQSLARISFVAAQQYSLQGDQLQQ